MSGHSKWSTIKRQKGAADIKRGQTFTKLANAITIAARLGSSPDPQSNFRLRKALDDARAQNMPKENVQRAIDRGLGKLPGQNLEEVILEGFGPNKVAFIVETVTDNRSRTLQEVKNLFERSGGNLTQAGSILYMFDRIGEIKVASKGGSRDDEVLELIDLGAKEIDETEGEEYLVYIESPELNTMSNKITQIGYRVESARVVFKPNTPATINEPNQAQKVVDFISKLEESDDILSVYTNL